MAPLCECGCGEYLPEGSTRRYKRGHSPAFKASGRTVSRPRASANSDSGWTEVTPETASQIPAEVKQDAWWEINDGGGFSIKDAAAITPDDPDPWGETKENKNPLEIKITASVRRDIEGKLAFMFGMTGNLWQMVDPVCGTALMQNSPNICKALVPIMCQSQAVVAWFQKASNFSMYLNLIMAVFPVLSVIYAHHLSHSIGQGGQSVNGHVPNATVPENAYGVT